MVTPGEVPRALSPTPASASGLGFAARLVVLWSGFILFACYGSLYPFHIVGVFDWSVAAGRLLDNWSPLHSRGDVLGNLLLFLPAGLLAGFSPRRFGRLGPSFAVAVLLVLATLLQLGQQVVPPREPALGDVILNAAGLTAGLSAMRWRRLRDGLRGLLLAMPLLPLLASGLGFLAVVLPGAPGISFSVIKHNLKAMLFAPSLDVGLAAAMLLGLFAVATMAARSLGAFAANAVLVLSVAAIGLWQIANFAGSGDLSFAAAAALAAAAWFAFARHAVAWTWQVAVPLLALAAALALPMAGAPSWWGADLLLERCLLAKVFAIGAALWLLRSGQLSLGASIGWPLLAQVVLALALALLGAPLAAGIDPVLTLALAAALWLDDKPRDSLPFPRPRVGGAATKGSRRSPT